MSHSQFSSPIIVSSDGKAAPLRRVAFSSCGSDFRYNEEWLQNLLFSNPNSIPTREIDSAYHKLVPICTELNTPVGPLDALYVTPDGKLVILEAKLWRNPEARRKVIGQILDYAKELNQWDYEELQKKVSMRCSESGNVIYNKVKALYPETDESEFVDGVSRSLRTGQFMLLIVGDGIREGAGAIAHFLDDVGYLQFCLGLIEAGVYETPGGSVLVQPRVLAKTVIINRTVIELASPEIRVQDSSENYPQAREEDSFFREFWMEFLNGLRLDDVSQRIPSPAKGPNLFFVSPPKGSNTWVNVYFAGSMGKVGVYFRLAKTEFGQMAYEILLAEKERILSELPPGTEWDSSDDELKVSIGLPVTDVRDPNNRASIKEFFAVNANVFVNTFRTRMEIISKRFEAI